MTADQEKSRAIADPDKIVWIRPETVTFKLTGSRAFKTTLAGIVPGDWDLQREAIEETAKYRSIVQHFAEGKDWEDTELFAAYAERLKRGDPVRGCRTMAELKQSYDVQVAQLYEGMKAEGFLLSKGRKESYPHVHIAREGDILFGRAGNHRFAMARILKIELIPCLVRARHERWQNLRARMFGLDPEAARKSFGAKLVEHPDMADVLLSEARG